MSSQQQMRRTSALQVQLKYIRFIAHVFMSASVVVLSVVLVQLAVTSSDDRLLLVGDESVTLLHPGIASLVIGVLLVSVLLSFLTMWLEQQKGVGDKRQLLEMQKHTSLDHDQLQTVLNSISVGIVGVSTGGTVRTYNAAFLSLLDTNESLNGRKINDVLPLNDSSTGTSVDIMSFIEKGTLIRHDDAILKYDEDGDEIRLGILVNVLRESGDQPAGYIFIIEDITKEKTLEEERDEFISVVSHELRTPVTVAEGSISNSQLLLERGADASLLRKSFKEAHDQVIFLAGMVNDLSTLSRAERGMGDTAETVVVDSLANDLYGKYTQTALEKGLQFNLDVHGRIGQITTSPLYLEEILQNFITNAIKYTPKGKVTLTIKRVQGGVQFAVADTGIGISVADQKKIFEKFYRSEDYRTRETSGTGLGLYVVQKLAKKLGVKVEVESRLNRGSTFSFTLPYNK